MAELLLLRALLQHNGTMALLVVPFIALAMEKRDYLRDVWAPLQVRPFGDAQTTNMSLRRALACNFQDAPTLQTQRVPSR